MNSLFLTQEAIRGVKKNVTMTTALVLTVVISLTLFGIGLLVQKQTETMKDYWYDKVELSIFLCGTSSSPEVCANPVTETQRDTIRRTLENNPSVSALYYESSDEAYGHFKEQFKDSPILSSVKPEDLPESFRVKLTTPEVYEEVAASIAELEGVEQTRDQKALLERFFSLLSSVQQAALIVAFGMLTVTVLLILNTVRLSAYSRRKETNVMKLVGASNLSIALPFILEAVVAAVVGATISIAVLFGIQHFIVEGRLAQTYTETNFITWVDVFSTSFTVFMIGTTVAAAAAAFSVKRHLKI